MIRFFLILILCCAAFHITVSAQKTAGAYVIYVDNHQVAEENFVSEKLADGTARTVSKVATATFITTTRNDQPVEFVVETGGAKVLTTTFSDGEARVTTGDGQPAKIIKTQAVVITENNVWSNYINLLAQYDRKKGGSQIFAAFLPTQSLTFPIALEKGETKNFKLKTGTISLSRYKLVNAQSGLQLTILADEAGIPYFIEIPAQQAQIVKKGFEELRETNAAANLPPPIYNSEFTGEEVSFPNGEITLAGTLTVPKNDKKIHPAVVIISGSGGQDRDGAQLFNLYKQIAESLSQAGIAVLRVDDRGMGKSTIVMAKANETSYRDLISDSRAAFDFLMTSKEIDKSKIALLGHSEGAETALTIAAEDKRVAAIMLLAGSSRPVDEVVIEQELYQRAWQTTADVADKTQINPLAQPIMKMFEEAKQPANAGNKKLAWFREHAASNPSQIAARVKCPVLIVQGERDALVLAYHAVALSRALESGGNRRVSLRILPNLTHIFTPIVEDKSEASKISPELLRTLQYWAAATLSATK